MGHRLKLKHAHSGVPSAYFRFDKILFRPTTVQMSNLAIVETKLITVDFSTLAD